MTKRRRNLLNLFAFVLVFLMAFVVVGVKATGYTYDHSGKVIYSTEGFTVNETPYIYSDLGISDSKLLASPTDLFVYKVSNTETVVYLLDGAAATINERKNELDPDIKEKYVSSHSTLFWLDDNLDLQVEIDYLVYNPNTVRTTSGLEKVKSAGVPVIGSTQVLSDVATAATLTAGYADEASLKSETIVPLYLNGSQSVSRFFKTNSLPFTDYIYICDTANNQVLVCDSNSYDPTLKTFEIVQIVTSPTDELGSATFNPTKVCVDAAGRIYIIANGVTNGIMEFSENGIFDRYIGTNYVALSAWDIFWRNFSTESQLASKTTILPTTFTSMIYKNNMIYTTSYVVTSTDGVTTNDTIMIKKINPSGKDVLRRNGYTVPKGDYTYFRSNDSYGTYGPSRFEGIAVNEYGVYTVVDSNRGRLFTYDNEGNLLYISGGTGTQIDKISIPEAIQYLGENLLVLDSKKKAIIKYEPTEIASVINQAVKLEYEGDNDAAYDYWEKVILLNANYEYAYVGIGKHYMNLKEYKTAMYYYKLGYHQINYGKAFKEYRNAIIKKNFAWVAILLLVIVIGSTVGKAVYRKKKGIKPEEMTGIGDE